MNYYKIILGILTLLCIVILLLQIKKRRFLSKTSVFCLTVLGAILVYHNYLLSNGHFLYAVSDGAASYLPRFTEIIRNMKSGWNWWDFSLGLGAYEPVNSPVCFNPFVYLSLVIGSFFGEPAMEVSFAWMQVLKMGLIAFFMFLFMKKLKISNAGCFYAGLSLAFSGTVILRGFWLFFTDECLLAVMLLYCVERMYQDHQWYLVSIMVCLTGISLGIYYLYLYALVLTVYITGRYVFDKKPARKYFAFILKCAGVYLLGIGLAGFYIIGVELYSTFNTARFSDSSSGLIQPFTVVNRKVLISAVMSLFGTDTMGVFDHYAGALNYLERPLFYSGISSLFFIAYALKYSSKDNRKIVISLLVLILIYLLFPFITNIFNAFIQNVELNAMSYRLSSLWITIAIVSLGGDGFEKLLEAEKPECLFQVVIGFVTMAVFIALIIIMKKYNYGLNDQKMVGAVILMIVIWTVIPWFCRRKKQTSLLLEAIVILCLFSEMGYAAHNTVNGSLDFSSFYYTVMQNDPMGYYGNINEVIQYLKETDKGFYRIGGIRTTAINARYSNPMYFGYYDSSYYTNIDQNTYEFTASIAPEAFDNNMGSKYSIGVGGILEPSEITAYKYFVAEKDNKDTKIPYGYTPVKEFGNLVLYQNKYPLSLGMTFERYILKKDFETYSVEDRRKILMNAVVLDHTDHNLHRLSEKEIKEIIKSGNSEYVSAAESLQKNAFQITSFHEDDISGEITVSETRKLIFSIPAADGWHLLIDGKEVKTDKADLGLLSTTIQKGSHTIRMYYRMPLLKAGMIVSMISIVILVISIWLTMKKHKKAEDTLD